MSKKIVILITVFVDILGLGIIIPVMPYYVQSFGISDFVVTMLFAVFALFSFFSAPVLGAMSDRIGRRPILIASILSTAVGWLVFASAQNVFMLFLGRIIDGAAAGNLPTAQNYLVDIARDPKERTTNLGLIGIMFGIGLTVGPFIGGTLGHVSHSLPFWTVGFMALANAVLAYFFLPEVHHERQEIFKLSFNPFRPIINSFRKQALLPYFAAWAMFSIAISIHQSIFALYLGRVFGLSELIAGYFFTAVGVGLIFNQMLLRKFWLVRFRESSLQKNMFLILASAFLIMSLHSLIFVSVGLLFLMLSQSTLRPVSTSIVVGIAKRESGEALGIMSSVFNLSSVVGPLVAGAVFQVQPSYPFYIAVAVAVAGYAILRLHHDRLEKESFCEECSTVA